MLILVYRFVSLLSPVRKLLDYSPGRVLYLSITETCLSLTAVLC